MHAHCWYREGFNRNLLVFKVLTRSFLPQKTIILSVIPSTKVIPNHVPSHPSLSLEDQPGELGTASAANTEKVGWQPWRRPKDGLQWPHLLPTSPDGASDSRERGADSREERTILYSSQTSLQGNKTLCDSSGKGKERRIWGGLLLIYKV